jgi:hypothetical protein
VDAITLCPFIICRNKDNLTMLNHEAIHVKQQLELLIIPFYVIYLLNWAYNLIKYKGDSETAYSEIFFEKEAYDNQDDLEYLSSRQTWSCLKKKD